MAPRALPVWVECTGHLGHRKGSRHEEGGPASLEALSLARGALEEPLGQTPGKQKSEELLSTYWPPKSCIPKSAKTTMNRKRRNNRLMMDFMELRRETTRFLRDAQYLRTEARGGVTVRLGPGQSGSS